MDNIISSKSLEFVLKTKKKIKVAHLTVKSLVTGIEYTFAISRREWNDKWYTNVEVEIGYMNFSKLGYYFDGNIINKGKVNTPAAIAIAWILKKVEEGKFSLLDENVHIMHTGSCLKCGRILTDSISIERGLGPICANI